MIFKKDKEKPTINWELVDSIARDVFKLLHSNGQVTFLELDCILNLVSTECNNQKYAYLLGKTTADLEHFQIKDVPGGLYG